MAGVGPSNNTNPQDQCMAALENHLVQMSQHMEALVLQNQEIIQQIQFDPRGYEPSWQKEQKNPNQEEEEATKED